VSRNQTDYDFPPDWGLYSDAEKHRWFVLERLYRQSERQYEARHGGDERLGTEEFRYDPDS